MKTLLVVSRIQAKVADLIEERGLYKNSNAPDVDAIHLNTCPLCVLAAFNVAAGGEINGELTDSAYTAARAFADWLGVDPVADLYVALGEQWNDRPEQTQSNVVQMLRRCSAELARAGR